MPYTLNIEDRKIAAEKETFNNFLNVLTVVGVEKLTAYKIKKVVVIEDQLSPSQVISLAHRKNVDCVAQNSLQTLDEKIKILARLDQDINLYFDENFSFFTEPTENHKIIFDSETSRQKIIDMVFHRLQIDIEASRSVSLKSALEELIMNTQIDARSLTDSKENKKSVLLIEKAEKIVAISLIDDYGTLIYSKFLNQIESCLNIGVSASINHNRQRGAGIGSSIIFNAIDSLYLGCIAGKKTRVTAIIPFGISDKIQEKLQKSIFLI